MRTYLLKFALICLLVMSFMAVACSTSSSTSSPEKTTTSVAVAASATTATAYTNWWDKFGEPQYGGTLTVRWNRMDMMSFDPFFQNGDGFAACYDTLWATDWTLDRSIWAFNSGFVPVEYSSGLLIKDWEQTDATTVTAHLREGICWQNKAPLNGREFVAQDIEYCFDRLLGQGSGFTEPSPWYSFMLSGIAKVTAVDNNTIQIQFKTPSAMSLTQLMGAFQVGIVSREVVEQGDVKDWQSAVGTGPWIVSDYVSGNSLTYSKNDNYWGYDERYPENRLPYVDSLIIRNIPDDSTGLAAMRTGKIDVMAEVTWRQQQSLSGTNPEVVWSSTPDPAATIDLICDQKPFTDIRVRTALQMALDLDTMAETLFGGLVDGLPCGLVSPTYTGFAFPYDQWSDTLKQEYAYNPDGAKNLLSDAGYAQGFTTNIVATGTGIGSSELIQAIKAYFKDINVEMEIIIMDQATLNSYTWAGKADQMIMTNWGGGLASPDMSLSSSLSDGAENCTNNNDSYYDSLYEQFTAATDMNEAKRLSVEADKYSIEQHWRVCTFPQSNFSTWQPWVKGYSGELLGGSGGTSYFCARTFIDQNAQ